MWSDQARRAAAEARRRQHQLDLARVNQLTPGALRSDNLREYNVQDLRRRFGLNDAQSRLLYARIQAGGARKFATRKDVRSYVRDAKDAEDAKAQTTVKDRIRDFNLATGKHATRTQGSAMHNTLQRFYKASEGKSKK